MTWGNVLAVLGSALLLGFAGSLYYTKRNLTATRSFAFTLALLPVIVATVIMAVNGNLGAGIAVAGSFSLIRFRSVQGTGKEILAVFLAAAVGLCLGAGYVAVACLLLMLCLTFHAVLSACGFGQAAENQREVRISVPESLDYDGLFDDLLDANFSAYELIRVRTVEMGTSYQLIYRGTLQDPGAGKRFLDAVRERNGNLPVSLAKAADAGKEM
uniref:DUF4956 domain-containing protein n=1 Tax=uncultured bacterium Contig46 TaxID=1393580 RepID=W0FL02_9BACT|nr:hypothetical protein [uncultured bacterium Contig46]